MDNKSMYVSKKTACEMLGISRPTMNNWLKSEKVKLTETAVGLSKRISVKEIEELKKQMEQKNY